jgi:hypothetical protein
MKDLTQIERGNKYISFFNELATENKNYARESRCNTQISVSFFNELDTKTRIMLITSISFFNEVAIEIEKTILVTGFMF